MSNRAQEQSTAAIAADAAHELCAPFVSEILEAREAIAALHAVEAAAMARMMTIVENQASRAPEIEELLRRSLSAELAAALRMNDRTVQGHLDEAVRLVRDFPVAHQALAEGRIHPAQAKVIADEGIRLEDDGLRTEYERLVLERAEETTQGRLRPIARSIAEQLLSTTIEERHLSARAGRRVCVTDLDDGMAELSATLPGVLAYGIHDRLTRMGKAIVRDRGAATAGDEGASRSAFGDGADHRYGDQAEEDKPADDRTLDQIRADVLSDLLLTGHPTVDSARAHGGDGLSAIRATVQVTIPVLSLAGLDDEAAVLAGHGPIDLDTARELAARAPSWLRVFAHPDTGALHTVDRHDPDASQIRLLRARDEHCRFPGCRQPASHSDKDHTRPYSDGGPTRCANLAHLCRRHHVLKHNSPWQVDQAGPGVLRWTSPLGRVYVDAPAPVLRFLPAVDRGGGGAGPYDDPPDPSVTSMQDAEDPPGPRFRPSAQLDAPPF